MQKNYRKKKQTERLTEPFARAYLDKLAKAPPDAQTVICNLLVIRYLERMADHATYVGEAIHYIATGEKIILR